MSEFWAAWWKRLVANHLIAYAPALVAVLVALIDAIQQGKALDARMSLALALAQVVALLRQWMSANDLKSGALTK